MHLRILNPSHPSHSSTTVHFCLRTLHSSRFKARERLGLVCHWHASSQTSALNRRGKNEKAKEQVVEQFEKSFGVTAERRR